MGERVQGRRLGKADQADGLVDVCAANSGGAPASNGDAEKGHHCGAEQSESATERQPTSTTSHRLKAPHPFQSAKKAKVDQASRSANRRILSTLPVRPGQPVSPQHPAGLRADPDPESRGAGIQGSASVSLELFGEPGSGQPFVVVPPTRDGASGCVHSSSHLCGKSAARRADIDDNNSRDTQAVSDRPTGPRVLRQA